MPPFVSVSRREDCDFWRIDEQAMALQIDITLDKIVGCNTTLRARHGCCTQLN
jgi:hypothetical protein